MLVSLKTAVAMIKRRKAQSFSIGIILSLTTLLLFVGISLLQSSEPFEDMYERAKGSHTFLVVNNSLHNVEKITDWWERQSNVENVQVIKQSKDVKIAVHKEGQREMDYFFFAEYDPNAKYDLIFTNNNEKPRPLGKSEIYINPVFAKVYKVEKDDELEVLINNKIEILTVADIVVDPQYSSMLSYSRNWVAEGFLDDYQIEEGATVGIRYIDYDQETETALLNEFEAFTSDDFPVQVIDFEMVKLLYSLLFTLISGVLLLVSILMLIIVIFIIRNTISYSIIDNFKSIGVMKATGFSNRNIIETYVFMYSILTLIATFVGIVGGYWLQGFLVLRLQSALNVPVSSQVLIPSIATVLILLTLVTIFSFITAKKGAKIKPVQAIKYGVPENKLAITKVSLRHLRILPLPFMLAFKQLLNKSKQTIVVIASHSLIIILCISMISLFDTFKGDQILNHFTSMPTGDMTISYQGEDSVEEILSNLKSHVEIDHAIYSTQILNSSVYSDENSKQIRVIGSMVLGNSEQFGVSVSKGRAPIHSNEILLTSKMLGETRKEIGDFIEIKTEIGTKKYLITGLYQTVNNLGLSYMIPYSDDIAMTQTNSLSFYTVSFSDQSIHFEDLKKILFSEYGDKMDVKRLDDHSAGIKGMLDQLPSVFLLLIITFYVVSGAAVMNWTMMDIKRSAKMFGLLKTSGFSNRQIIGMLMTKTLIITLFASMIGFILAINLAPYFLEVLIMITPFQISNLTLQLSVHSAVMTVGLYFFITIIATILPARRIRKITPRVLIIE